MNTDFKGQGDAFICPGHRKFYAGPKGRRKMNSPTSPEAAMASAAFFARLISTGISGSGFPRPRAAKGHIPP